MGWFQRLLGGSSRSGPVGPVTADLVPGKLRATIHTHDFAVGSGAVPCWTYVTSGFAATGQKEFVFTLARGKADPTRPPSDPLNIFAQIFSFAEQKRFVDVGGHTCFQPRAGFLGLTGLIGFAYTRPEALPGIELPPLDRCLNAILLLPGEAELVQAGWGYRVLARLGRSVHYFPHPPWSDPRRSPVLSRAELGTSLSGQLPGAPLDGAHVRMFRPPTHVPAAGQTSSGGTLGDRIALRIQRERLPRLREMLAQVAAGPEGAFTLLLEADPDANAHLAWLPGDTAPYTITPATGDASCMTGGFLALVYGPTIGESGRVLEDGFALTLGADSWARLRTALTAGEPLTLPANGPEQLGLSVEWLDGPTPGSGTETAAAPPPGSAFRIDSMLLYQPDDVLKVRAPSVESLTEFIKQVESSANEFWTGQPTGAPQPVLVVAAFKPGGRVRVWVDVPAGLETEPAARELAARLGQLPAPVVQHGPVAIAMRGSLWGGGGEWPFIPKEWQDATRTASESLLVPDGILERVWPD
jgi:hypothetical protein